MALKDYYRNLRGRRLDDEYINEIKDTIKLTKEQIQAYKILTTYKLSKELELYDNYDELFENYFWILVATIDENSIFEYVKIHCQ